MALAVVRDVLSAVFAGLPPGLEERITVLVDRFGELDMCEQRDEEFAKKSKSRKQPGSRRWNRRRNKRRKELEPKIFHEVYPRTKDRRSARARLWNDLMEVFRRIAHVAKTKAQTAPVERRTYYEQIAFDARQHLRTDQTKRTKFRERVMFLALLTSVFFGR